MQPFKTTIAGSPVLVNSNLSDYDLYKKASSNVDYFGVFYPKHNDTPGTLFIQFNNGKCFIYGQVPIEVLKEAVYTESIGKFYHSDIKGKYQDTPVEDRCIRPDDQDDDDDDHTEGDFGLEQEEY